MEESPAVGPSTIHRSNSSLLLLGCGDRDQPCQSASWMHSHEVAPSMDDTASSEDSASIQSRPCWVEEMPRTTELESTAPAAIVSLNDELVDDEVGEGVGGEGEGHSFFCNRILFCLMALCFLWMTSLEICASIASKYIAVPTFGEVVHNCHYAFDQTTEEKRFYDDCVNRQLDICHRDLTAALQSEQLITQRKSDVNNVYRAKFTSFSSNCSQDLSSAKALITAWLSGGADYTIPYQSSCSGSKQAALQQMIGDSSSSKSDFLSTTQFYTQDTNNRVSRLTSYASALGAYNAQYLSNKTSYLHIKAIDIAASVSLKNIIALNKSFNAMFTTMNNLVACVSLDPTSTEQCPYGPSAYQLMEVSLYETQVGIDQVQGAVAMLQANLQVYIANVKAAVANMESFYNSIAGAKGLLTYILNILNTVGLGSIALCGQTTPDFCSFSLSDFLVPDPWLPTIPAMPTLPALDGIWSEVSGAVGYATSDINHAAGGLYRGMVSWEKSVASAIGSIDFTPKDYNPPKYPGKTGNASQEVIDQQASTQSFLSQAKVYLYQPNSTSTKITAANSLHSLNSSAVATSTSLLSQFRTSWASFHLTGINFGWLLAYFTTLHGLLFILDYLFRIVASLKLIVQFWSRGSVKLPEIDLTSRRPDINAKWFTYIQWFFRLLPLIWVQLLLIVGLIALIGWCVSSVLIPEYHSYSSACVRHTSSQSFLSQNLASSAFNYAAMDGNAAVTKGLAQYNLDVTQGCASGVESTKSAYLDILNELARDNQTYAVSSQSRNLLFEVLK